MAIFRKICHCSSASGVIQVLPHCGYSNKYPQHVFLVHKLEASLLLPIILLDVGNLYRGKFFLKEKSLGTNTVVIMRGLCN